MSAVDEVLSSEVERLAKENNALKHQNERLSRLLAEALNVLQQFKRSADDKLRHYSLAKNATGRFDWRKLLNR